MPHNEKVEINIGEKIKKLRLDKNIDLPKLAELTGFSTALLSQMENHLISPPLSSLGKIAGALGVEMGYFFGSSSDVDFTIVRRNERRPISRVASKQELTMVILMSPLPMNKKIVTWSLFSFP